jgi:hypothetical protein
MVELRERIVEQHHRLRARGQPERRCLQQPQGDRGGALLSRRPERAEVAGIQRELEVIAVGTGVRHPALHVEAPASPQRREKCPLGVGVIAVHWRDVAQCARPLLADGGA